MRNIRLIVKYDGSRYKGFQRLKDNDMTIQNKIESVLSKMTGEDIEIIGSGRTDMGVHSLGQVVNFKTNSDIRKEKMNEYLYRYLPEDMVIKDIKQVSDRFHSRYNAVSKTYLYKIYNDKYHDPFYRKYTLHIKDILDIKLMQEASDILVGKHDFTSFASSKSKKKSNIRQINKIDIIKQDNIVNIYKCRWIFIDPVVYKNWLTFYKFPIRQDGSNYTIQPSCFNFFCHIHSSYDNFNKVILT